MLAKCQGPSQNVIVRELKSIRGLVFELVRTSLQKRSDTIGQGFTIIFSCGPQRAEDSSKIDV